MYQVCLDCTACRPVLSLHSDVMQNAVKERCCAKQDKRQKADTTQATARATATDTKTGAHADSTYMMKTPVHPSLQQSTSRLYGTPGLATLAYLWHCLGPTGRHSPPGNQARLCSRGRASKQQQQQSTTKPDGQATANTLTHNGPAVQEGYKAPRGPKQLACNRM